MSSCRSVIAIHESSNLADSAGLRVEKSSLTYKNVHHSDKDLQLERERDPRFTAMASTKETETSSQDKKKDEKPVANGVKKDEPEELVRLL